MKIFAMIAHQSDGTRNLLWVKRLPEDFDFEAWADSRKRAAKLLGIVRFTVEEL